MNTAIVADQNSVTETRGRLIRVGIVNPLPDALDHFERSLASLLSSGEEVSVSALPVAVTEMWPGASGVDRLRQAFRYLKSAHRVSRESEVDVIINVWPALGYLESLVWSRSSVPVITILHDVVPLRSQFGYWSRWVPAFRRLTRKHHRWVVHGERAASDARAVGFGELPIVPHPLMPGALGDTSASSSPRNALVFGQWKPARDLDLLVQLAPGIESLGLRPVITGRGWPAVRGWNVEDRFVDEVEVEPLLRDAGILLLPYAHYYQSGVALRALENGTGVVGVRTAFLEEFFGSDWPGFVTDPDDPGAWLDAIDRTRALNGGVLGDLLRSAQRNGTQRWTAVLLAYRPDSSAYFDNESGALPSSG